ncbi:MAG: hypothetical protein ACT4PU_01155 [Planctomycetota bacterium]
MITTRTLLLNAVTSVCWLAFAPAALAHEGHGEEEFSGTMLHQLLEPAHAWPFWLLAMGVLGVALAVKKVRARR